MTSIDPDYEQWLYYRELRLEHKRSQYAKACTLIKGFEHSSVGVKLAKELNDLAKDISTTTDS